MVAATPEAEGSWPFLTLIIESTHTGGSHLPGKRWGGGRNAGQVQT